MLPESYTKIIIYTFNKYITTIQYELLKHLNLQTTPN